MAAAAALVCVLAAPIRAGSPAIMPKPVDTGPTYADLADLADSAPLILRLQIRKQAVVEPARAGHLEPGKTRLYVEARALDLLVGARPVGEDLSFLVDVALDAHGKVPTLKRTVVLAFARDVAGSPAEIQLIAPEAQLAWSPEVEARLRNVLVELRASGAPSRVTAVRDAMFVPGTLAGEGETQISLSTAQGSPASISVTHVPGQPVVWAASFGEVFDTSGKPPASGTLAWYRLACFLPHELPANANLSGGETERTQAAADYRLVINTLGPCSRTHG